MLNADDIHVWIFSPGSHSTLESEKPFPLSPEERERQERFRSPVDGRRFAFGRRMLRTLLAGYASSSPEEICIGYNSFGKPRATAPEKAAAVHFNLSHAGEAALAAFSRKGPLGVDLERKDPSLDCMSLSGRFFHPEEHERMGQAQPAERTDFFFLLWVLKESVLKATGTGFAGNPAGPCVLTAALRGHSRRGSVFHGSREWETLSFEPLEGHAAAVAFSGPAQRVLFFCPGHGSAVEDTAPSPLSGH